MADPAPIAYTLLAEPVLQHHFRLGGIITTVDAVNGIAQLRTFPEPVKQIAMADRLIVTKTDLAPEDKQLDFETGLRQVNKSAPIIRVKAGDIQPASLLIDDLYDQDGRQREVQQWLKATDGDNALLHEHADQVQSFSVTYDEPLDWTAFGIWMSMLLHRHGDNVLRIKGLLNVADVPTPVLINGVQHIVHPPSHLPDWPNKNRQSRIIFIVRHMDQVQIKRSLAVFNRLANSGSTSGKAA